MNRRNIIIIISILAFIVIVGGVSYSYFIYNKDVGDINLDTGSISINLSNVSGNQTLTNVIPLSDNEGKTTSDYFDFTVTGTVDTERIYYEVYLLPKSGNTLDTSYLKVYLTDQNDNKIRDIRLYDILANSEKENGKIIYKDTIELNNNETTRNETKNFRLRIWLDESYEELQSKTFDFDIYLYAKNVDSSFEISSPCPGCKFLFHPVDVEDDTSWLYTTWASPGTPSVITEGLYDEYEEVVTLNGTTHFLAVKLNGNSQITNAYSCGFRNNVAFCIEGTSDGAEYNANNQLLQKEDVYDNTCTFTGNPEYLVCGPWGNSGVLSAFNFPSGNVGVGIGYYTSCDINSNGRVGCYDIDPGN